MLLLAALPLKIAFDTVSGTMNNAGLNFQCLMSHYTVYQMKFICLISQTFKFRAYVSAQIVIKCLHSAASKAKFTGQRGLSNYELCEGRESEYLLGIWYELKHQLRFKFVFIFISRTNFHHLPILLQVNNNKSDL